jgi:hypothetical protein
MTQHLLISRLQRHRRETLRIRFQPLLHNVSDISQHCDHPSTQFAKSDILSRFKMGATKQTTLVAFCRSQAAAGALPAKVRHENARLPWYIGAKIY